MKNFIVISGLVFLTGCSTIQSWIPSFWDDNQSAAIVSVRQNIHNIDCTQPQHDQAFVIGRALQWFRLYSDSKGSVQQDVLRLTEPMEKTVAEWQKRAEVSNPSEAYCRTKKKILVQQADRAASAVLGRW